MSNVQNSPSYRRPLSEALSTTPLERVLADTATADAFADWHPVVHANFAPFLVTTVFDVLGLDRGVLQHAASAGDSEALGKRVLMFAHSDDGEFFSSFAHVLARAGCSVTVASPDSRERRPAKPHTRLALAQLSMAQLDGGQFDLAILDGHATGLRYPEPRFNDQGEARLSSPADCMAGLALAIRQGGSIVVSSISDSDTIRTDPIVADVATASFEVQELPAYAYERGSRAPVAWHSYLMLQKK